MSQINYEQEVRKIYPDAKCAGVGLNNSKPLWYMIFGIGLREKYLDTRKQAWKSAYQNLKQQGKL